MYHSPMYLGIYPFYRDYRESKIPSIVQMEEWRKNLSNDGRIITRKSDVAAFLTE